MLDSMALAVVMNEIRDGKCLLAVDFIEWAKGKNDRRKDDCVNPIYSAFSNGSCVGFVVVVPWHFAITFRICVHKSTSEMILLY